MKLRSALVPAALLAALAFTTVDTAEAAPLPVKHSSKAFFGPRVFVGGGIGVTVPISPRRRVVRHAPAYVAPAGHWDSVPYQVWVPGHVIGYDAHGHPIQSAGHHVTQYRRVWVPAPVVVHHRPVVRGYVGHRYVAPRRVIRHRIRPRVRVGLGVGIRIR